MEELNGIVLQKNRVLVKRAKKEEEINGLLIPEISQEKQNKGVVVKKAPDVESVTIGDYVYFIPFTGMDIKINGVDLLLLIEENIVAKETNEDTEAQ